MSEIQFLKFEPISNEKHIGIATISFLGKIILRYKIIPTKDGLSYFPAPGSLKAAPLPGKPDHYVAAFTIDSNYIKEEIETLIMANVNDFLRRQVAPQASVHQTPWPNQANSAPANPAINQSWPPQSYIPQTNPNFYGTQQPQNHPEIPLEDPTLPF